MEFLSYTLTFLSPQFPEMHPDCKDSFIENKGYTSGDVLQILETPFPLIENFAIASNNPKIRVPQEYLVCQHCDTRCRSQGTWIGKKAVIKDITYKRQSDFVCACPFSVIQSQNNFLPVEDD